MNSKIVFHRSFKEAKEFARSLGLKNSRAWQKYSKDFGFGDWLKISAFKKK